MVRSVTPKTAAAQSIRTGSSRSAEASGFPGRASGVTRKNRTAERNRTAENTSAVGLRVMVSPSAASPRR